jgi:hypothetical protein
MTSLQSWEKLTSNDSFTNSVTLTAPNVITWRQKKSIEGDPDQGI